MRGGPLHEVEAHDTNAYGTVDSPLDTMHAAFTPSPRISREMRLLYWRSRLGSFEVAEKEID